MLYQKLADIGLKKTINASPEQSIPEEIIYMFLYLNISSWIKFGLA